MFFKFQAGLKESMCSPLTQHSYALSYAELSLNPGAPGSHCSIVTRPNQQLQNPCVTHKNIFFNGTLTIFKTDVIIKIIAF